MPRSIDIHVHESTDVVVVVVPHIAVIIVCANYRAFGRDEGHVLGGIADLIVRGSAEGDDEVVSEMVNRDSVSDISVEVLTGYQLGKCVRINLSYTIS